MSIAEPKALSKALAHSKCPTNHCEIIVKQLALKVRIGLPTDTSVLCLDVSVKYSVN